MKNNFLLIIISYFFIGGVFANELEINANQVDVEKDNKLIVAEGDVEILDSKNNLIITEKAVYDKKKDLLKASGQTEITTSEKFKILGTDVIYNKKDNIIYSENETVVVDIHGNKIFVNMFNYLTEKKMFLSKGEIKIEDTRGNIYYFSEIYIDEKKKKIVGSDVKSFINERQLMANERNQPRFFANSGVITNEGVTLEKGVFTTCEYREKDKCPPWSIKAKQIKHDSAKKTVYYENAVLEVYDFPIFYFPKFFHPDPTVKRQSGFLLPLFKNTSDMGFSTTMPYFWAMSKNRDMTITPKIYTNENIIVMNEYRHAFKNGFWIVDSSYTKGYKNTTDAKLPGGRAHLFSRLSFDLSGDNNYFSDLQVNFQHLSNDTYLKVHDIETALADKDETILTSNINYEFQDEKVFFGASASMFENTEIVDRKRYEYILPNLVFERNIYSSDKFGLVDIYSNAFAKNYSVNQYTKMFVNDFNWKSRPFLNLKGIQSDIEGLLKVVNYEADNADKYKVDGLTTEASTALSFNAKMPLVKKNKSGNKINLLTPRFSLRMAPNQMRDIQDDMLRLNYSNLFSLNKNSQVDVIERGTSAILGLELSNNNIENNIPGARNYSVKIGQVYNLEENENIPSRSSLDQKTSDLVGEGYLKVSDNLTLTSNFALDHNFNDVNYQDLNANLILGNTNFNIKYLEENNHIGSAAYVKSDIKVNFKNSTELTFDLKKNLETNSTEFYNLAYDYINDCLKAGLVFRREFYADRDVEASDSLMFRISFLPFGGVENISVD